MDTHMIWCVCVYRWRRRRWPSQINTRIRKSVERFVSQSFCCLSLSLSRLLLLLNISSKLVSLIYFFFSTLRLISLSYYQWNFFLLLFQFRRRLLLLNIFFCVDSFFLSHSFSLVHHFCFFFLILPLFLSIWISLHFHHFFFWKFSFTKSLPYCWFVGVHTENNNTPPKWDTIDFDAY